MLLTKVKIKELYTSIESWFWFVFFADVCDSRYGVLLGKIDFFKQLKLR